MRLSRFFIIFLLFVCSSAWAESFPKAISYAPTENNTESFAIPFKDYRFRLAGISERSVLFFSVYEVALYLNAQSNELDESFVLWLRYSRDLSRSSIESALRKGLEANSKKEDLKEILHVFNGSLLPKLRDVTEGESLRLIRLSPAKAVVEINEKNRSFLEGERFLEALFSIWLGEDSVVSRSELFSLSD